MKKKYLRYHKLHQLLKDFEKKWNDIKIVIEYGWETLAPTNSIADEFLHVATQAPQPIHVAASIALSAAVFEIRVALASCVFPDVFTEI